MVEDSDYILQLTETGGWTLTGWLSGEPAVISDMVPAERPSLTGRLCCSEVTIMSVRKTQLVVLCLNWR